MDKEIRSYQGKLEIRAADGQTTVAGYAAVFDAWSQDLGGFIERIQPGAFDAVLRSNPDVALLVDHQGLPLGRTTSGTLQLAEDGTGLKFDCVLDTSDPDVQRLIPKVRRGDMSGCSFAFVVDQESWEMGPQGDRRTIVSVADLLDVAIVVTPAYPQTSVALRSRHQWYERVLQTQRGIAADVAAAALELERARGFRRLEV